MKRKDMGDLKKDIADTAKTSKEIVQNLYYDAKAEAQNAADDIKKDAQDVGRDVKQTSEKISRKISASKRLRRDLRV